MSNLAQRAVILAFDPGIAATGYILSVDRTMTTMHGVLKTKATTKSKGKDKGKGGGKNWDYRPRTLSLAQQVMGIVSKVSDGYAGRPLVIAYEDFVHSHQLYWTGIQTLRTVGILAAAAAFYGADNLLAFTAAECKRGTDGKDGIRKLIENTWPSLEGVSQHVIDATAVAWRAMDTLEKMPAAPASVAA